MSVHGRALLSVVWLQCVAVIVTFTVGPIAAQSHQFVSRGSIGIEVI